MSNASAPVVVGVDGSNASITAVKWAIDEAVSRDVPLRLVHVTHIEEQPAAPEDAFRLDVQYAEAALRAASAAVKATGKKPVTVETQILWGPPDTALIDESHGAAMVCVGSLGIGPIARKLLGSTAATLAEKASCPVAIIRTPHDAPAGDTDPIVVVVEDHPDNESVIEHGMAEARLRKAPVRAVGVIAQGEVSNTQCPGSGRQFPTTHLGEVARNSVHGGSLATGQAQHRNPGPARARTHREPLPGQRIRRRVGDDGQHRTPRRQRS